VIDIADFIHRPGEQHENTASEEIPNALSKYTNDEVAQLRETLGRQLGPEYISIRPGPGNTKLMYVAGEKVINLANDVFGFNGWSSSIRSVILDAVSSSVEVKRSWD
jgi:DNA repair and recombination protein RAD52